MKTTLWTIQDEAAFVEMKKTGYLRANGKYIDEYFIKAYDYISEQLEHKAGKPPHGVRYPIWAWYQWEGKRKRMDQRCGGYAARGTPLVQITFEADEAEILLSDFDLWHYVLRDQYIGDSEEEDDNFSDMTDKAAYGSDEYIKCKKLKYESYQKIFDLTYNNPYRDCPPDKKSIQAVMWEIKTEQIIKAEYFIAK